MPGREELRRNYLAGVCRALATYIEHNYHAQIKTVTDDEAVVALVEELRGRSAVIFTIEDWAAFRDSLEPDSERLKGEQGSA